MKFFKLLKCIIWFEWDYWNDWVYEAFFAEEYQKGICMVKMRDLIVNGLMPDDPWKLTIYGQKDGS